MADPLIECLRDKGPRRASNREHLIELQLAQHLLVGDVAALQPTGAGVYIEGVRSDTNARFHPPSGALDVEPNVDRTTVARHVARS